jgi:hypothetical protein
MDGTTRRAARALAALVAAAGLGACHDVLNVDRPGQITQGQVTKTNPDALVAAATGEYHVAFNWVANSGAAATDEAIFSHGWSPWDAYDARDVAADAPAWDGIGYPWMQRARVTGVRSAQQLRDAHAPAAYIGTALDYAGFSTLLLADYLCKVPLDGGPALDRPAAYDSAIALFQQALTAGGTDDSVANLANLGIARAYLNKHQLNEAITYAKKVSPNFEAWVRFVDSPNFGDWVDKYNLYYRTSGFESPTEFSLALDPGEWTGKTDLRVPFDGDSARRMFTSNPFPRSGFVPFTPYSFEGWTPGNHRMITGGEDIRFASGLEAKYIIAEASLYGGTGGWSDVEVRAFIDSRRAVGGLGPYAGTDLKGELREQRKMDFFFAGYRLPDLIRYKTYYSVDLWPKGKMGGYPAAAPYTYGSTECWPIGQSELSTNPNL